LEVLSEEKYPLEKFGIVSPYQGQTQKLRSFLRDVNG
jgi:superfamily I DNA and/or RNA helicase